jgi:hypothetical protein
MVLGAATAHWQDAAATPPEWLLGPTATAVALTVLCYMLLNLAIAAVGVEKVAAWRTEMQARLEAAQPWLFRKAEAVDVPAPSPAAVTVKARRKRPGRSKRAKAPWSVFFLGAADDEEETDAGPFDLDDDSWCGVMSMHVAVESPIDHHFIGEATPEAVAQQDVYDLGDDAWHLASRV